MFLWTYGITHGESIRVETTRTFYLAILAILASHSSREGVPYDIPAECGRKTALDCRLWQFYLVKRFSLYANRCFAK